MANSSKKYTCAIARSTNLIGDKWSLLIMRDVILHKKSRFKEFRSSKEKIATNILTTRLDFLVKEGFLEKITPLGTKKSTRYIALDKGMSTLNIVIEMYLFSIHSIDESVLDESQIAIKSAITSNPKIFKEEKIKGYLKFVKELKAL
ncbi:helix-turn-helix transcriptional regulator [Flavobacteriaceae bacterium]|jgi:DNA-binding HxlR family transcriptional regulator|nr:helix-turn-helix transcriptional regulator [Flavobacteriaceae bacterium]MDB9912866.1 helix-turn-helix transcriptional regulator [Flavobacteriaceae bacterium]|tara:strand:+ start:466 stop:906 length:441 start_codon:yes stop_codon:yes gene_type:complete